ncbi:COME operon protein 3 [Borrelia crocidurae DOU]|uniref:COME operon protein 3 n=1 Tax=Borrelia crocidurae DOU TaxID=1293575 RepID=W5SIB7_9SPIR|nr:COME operon protein 3 [Borrelia crocidurae DOU]
MIFLFIISALSLSIRYYLKLNLIYLNIIPILIFIIKKNAHLSLTFIINTSLLIIFEISLIFNTLENNYYQITNITIYISKYKKCKKLKQ